MSALGLYEKMSELSGEMVLAAQANDWDRLSELEAHVTQLRQTLEHTEAVGQATPVALAGERQRRITLIKKILADDREVRRHTEPWMDSVRALLSGQGRGKSMRQAYGALSK